MAWSVQVQQAKPAEGGGLTWIKNHLGGFVFRSASKPPKAGSAAAKQPTGMSVAAHVLP